jgi:hypothetical protein
MPWATDLLPHEIDENKKKMLHLMKKNQAIFIGTVGGGAYSNKQEIELFKKACNENAIPFIYGGCCNRSMEDNVRMVMESILAPAIQGKWQCEKGYIPCRIFKNISYGAMGITNSKTVYELFDQKIVYNSDPYKLGHDAIKALKSWTIEKQFELMDLVRDEHTYLNRIASIFDFFDMVNAAQNEA